MPMVTDCEYIYSVVGQYEYDRPENPEDCNLSGAIGGNFSGWYKTDINVYNAQNGDFEFTIGDRGPWYNPTLGYCLPMTVDENGKIYVVNGQARLSAQQGWDDIYEPNFSPTNLYGWHYSDIEVLTPAGLNSYTSSFHLDKGPWHRAKYTDRGYSLPIAIDSDGQKLYVGNGLYRKTTLEMGFDDVWAWSDDFKPPPFENFIYSDLTIYDLPSFMNKMNVRAGGPWHNSTSNFTLPMPNVTFTSNCPPEPPHSKPNSKPETFRLKQNYPNPFNASTKIEFAIPKETNVEIKIFNILGQEVKTLVNDVKQTGNYSIQWDGTNNQNKVTSSGVYIYKIQTKEFTDVKKMLLLK